MLDPKRLFDFRAGIGLCRNSKYCRILVPAIVSLLVCVITVFLGRRIGGKNHTGEDSFGDNSIHVFTQKFCPHCQDFKKFLEEQDLSGYEVKFHELEDRKNLNLLLRYAHMYRLPLRELTTPIIFSKNGYSVGFERGKEDGRRFLEILGSVTRNLKLGTRTEDEIALPQFRFKLTVLTAIRNVFSIRNLYTFLFLFLILFWCK
ncbi:MAG: hypothetical protein LBB24_00975, partial [Rickettsiales bacterium]|nr:hypothetical protein [Rickettsiales bacterium]